MLVNVYGMMVEEHEVDSMKAIVRKTMKDELHEAIRQEIGKGVSFKAHIFWQDDIMICGTFKACNGKKGTFSVLKSIVPCPVVNLH